MAAGDKERTLTLLAKVDQKTVERSIAHLRELRKAEEQAAAGQNVLDRSSEQVSASLGEVSDEVQQNISATQKRIAQSRLEVESITRQIKALEDEKEARVEVTEAAEKQAAAADDASRRGTSAGPKGIDSFESAGRLSTGLASFGALLPGGAGNAVRGLGDIAGAIEQLPRVTEAIKGLAGGAGEAAPAVAGLAGGVGGLVAAGAAGIALAALAVAIQKFTEQLNEAQAQVDSAFNAQEQYYRLVKTGTAESIQAELQRLQVEKYVREQTVKDAEAATAGLTGFQKVIADIAAFFGFGVAKNIKEANKELTDINAQIGAYERALQSSEVQQRTTAQTAKQETTAVQQATTAIKATTTATQQATTAEKQRSSAIQQTTQALSFSQQIATNYATYLEGKAKVQQDYAKKLATLEEQRQKILADGQATQIKIADDARRDQEKAARELSFNIAKILARATLDQFESLLTLDFAGAARSRRETQFAIAEASSQFSFDTQERLLDAQQRLEENRLAIQKQLVTLDQQRAQLIADQTKAIADLWKQLISAQLAIASQRMSRRAIGGPLAAGQASLVNENYGQRESFNGEMLPSGSGVFYPFRPGTVTNNTNNTPVNITIVESRNARETAREVERVIREMTK